MGAFVIYKLEKIVETWQSWFNAAVSKTAGLLKIREFESHRFLQLKRTLEIVYGSVGEWFKPVSC